MDFTKIKFLAPLAAAAALMGAAGSNTITVKGSDTMVIMAQRWAEAYMAKHPGTVVQVTGGGSGTGISALINGSTDICNSSRPMKGSERAALKARYATLGVEIKTAKDGLSVYVNDNNPVKSLDFAQLKGIYTGKIKNWKEVGGPDAKIIVYGRENSSGTYAYFQEKVLDGADYSSSVQGMPGTAAVVNSVSKDRFGIGYGGMAYAKGIRLVAVRKDAGSPAVVPSEATVNDGSYPISRYLYMYTANRPTGAVKEYIDWVLSREGQEIAAKVGYFPVK